MKYFHDYDSLNENKESRQRKRKYKALLKTKKKNSKTAKKEEKDFLKDYTELLYNIQKFNKNGFLDDETKSLIVADINILISTYKQNLPEGTIINLDDYKDKVKGKYLDEHSIAIGLLETDKGKDVDVTIISNDTQAKKNGIEILSKDKPIIDETDKKSKSDKISFDIDDKYTTIANKIKTDKKAPQLSVGSKGNYVKMIQNISNGVLGVGIKEDGIFGPNTKKYIQQLQTKLKVKNDGYFGTNSWSALYGEKIETKGNESESKSKSEQNPKGTSSYKTNDILSRLKDNDSITIEPNELVALMEKKFIKNNILNETIQDKTIELTKTDIKIYDKSGFLKSFPHTINNNKLVVSDDDKTTLKQFIKDDIKSEYKSINKSKSDNKTGFDDKIFISQLIDMLSYGDYNEAFLISDLKEMNVSSDGKLESISDDGYENVYGLINYAFDSWVRDINEDKWLNLYSNMNTDDLFNFINKYNSEEHMVDNEMKSINFFDDMSVAFDKNEMAKLKKSFNKKGLDIENKNLIKK